MRRSLLLSVLPALAAVAACGSSSTPSGTGSEPVTVTLLTHDSFATSSGIFDEFTASSGIRVEVVQGADAGTLLNKAILTAGNPEGDLLWGVDNTLLSRAVKAGVFSAYVSPELKNLVPAVTGIVPNGLATPVDYGDVCVNYDRRRFPTGAPRTLDDLITPATKGMLVVQNPATSSPGLAFLLATVAAKGDPGWKDYWKALRANDVKIVDGWTQAYQTEFSGSAGKGPRPLVVSYASSPPAEVVFAEDPKPTEAPTASMTEGCFRQVEFVGVLKGTRKEAAARRVVDFLVSRRFQEDMPLNMFVFPARADATVPEEFTRWAATVSAPLSLAPGVIEANRERWIEEWTSIMLR
jgi:thiamine transport system substrate-binding protein